MADKPTTEKPVPGPALQRLIDLRTPKPRKCCRLDGKTCDVLCRAIPY